MQLEVDTARTMTNDKATTKDALARSRKRGFSAGVTAIEELLMIAAITGCFVYPLSRAAIASGRQISQNAESAHETILRQR